jgi:hypothetical protein
MIDPERLGKEWNYGVGQGNDGGNNSSSGRGNVLKDFKLDTELGSSKIRRKAYPRRPLPAKGIMLDNKGSPLIWFSLLLMF